MPFVSREEAGRASGYTPHLDGIAVDHPKDRPLGPNKAHAVELRRCGALSQCVADHAGRCHMGTPCARLFRRDSKGRRGVVCCVCYVDCCLVRYGGNEGKV